MDTSLPVRLTSAALAYSLDEAKRQHKILKQEFNLNIQHHLEVCLCEEPGCASSTSASSSDLIVLHLSPEPVVQIKGLEQEAGEQQVMQVPAGVMHIVKLLLEGSWPAVWAPHHQNRADTLDSSAKCVLHNLLEVLPWYHQMSFDVYLKKFQSICAGWYNEAMGIEIMGMLPEVPLWYAHPAIKSLDFMQGVNLPEYFDCVEASLPPSPVGALEQNLHHSKQEVISAFKAELQLLGRDVMHSMSSMSRKHVCLSRPDDPRHPCLEVVNMAAYLFKVCPSVTAEPLRC